MAKLLGARPFGCSTSTSSINVSDAASDKVLEVRNLVTAFDTDAGQLTAVDSVSFDVRRGRTLGIVGESGCGKSVTAMSIMRTGQVERPLQLFQMQAGKPLAIKSAGAGE